MVFRKHRLGMPGGKISAAQGCTRLEYDRSPLRGLFDKVMSGHIEKSSFVIDLMHLLWIGKRIVLPVMQNCTVIPALFPELVDHFQELVRPVIPHRFGQAFSQT